MVRANALPKVSMRFPDASNRRLNFGRPQCFFVHLQKDQYSLWSRPLPLWARSALTVLLGAEARVRFAIEQATVDEGFDRKLDGRLAPHLLSHLDRRRG